MTRKISDCHYVLNLLPVKHLQKEILAELIGAEGRGVELHTHTKRHAVFLWSWQAEWLAGACAVRLSHFMTFLHEVIFAQLLANGVLGIA